MTAAVSLSLYAVVVGCLLTANHRHCRRERTLRIGPPYPRNVPVPISVTQADVDETWASVWPSAVDEDRLVDAEFVSIISAEWHWPDVEDAS